MPFLFPSCQVRCEPILKLVQFFELLLSFGKRGFGYRDDAAAGFLPLPAQTHDAPDFVQGEAERLRFADEPYLVQRGVVVHAISTRRSRWLREKPAPLVKADCVGPHSRKLRQPANQQRLLIHRLSNAACSRVIRPSNMMSPFTTTVGIAR